MKKLIKKIKYDCIYYTGYKPCGFSKKCFNCKQYVPQGMRILIIKLSAIGDVLRTTPILPALKRKYDPCFITWITDSNAIPVLKLNSLIDRLLPFDFPSTLGLQSEKFDLLINFEKEDAALALSKLVSADKKMGFAPSEYGTLSIYNKESEYALLLGISDELKFRKNKKTYIEIIFEMVGLDYSGEEYILPLSEQSYNFYQKFRKKHNLDKFKYCVGINTGCGDIFATKAWTEDGFVGLINDLSKNPGLKCILLGGPLEQKLNQKIKRRVSKKIIDAGCNNSLEDFIGIVNCCDVIVTSDSLAMHISVGLKKKTIVFFGATCHQEIDLFSRGEKIISDFPCSPCYKQRCEKKPTCMESLNPEKVASAVKKVLKIDSER